MPFVPGLRSEYSLVGGIVHFGRMLDKIRLHASGLLPADYHANLGIGFDGRTCEFLGVSYTDLKTRTLAGGCDEAVLAWSHQQGGNRTHEQCMLWNRFIMKLGWRDDRTPVLRDRISGSNLGDKPIETFFDFNEYDEGRDPVASRSWELKEPRLLLIMGVAGSGKTTIGQLLAAQLNWSFTDADDFHPASNLAKMKNSEPLTDEDRAPWLAAVRSHINSSLAAHENTVLACSALKSSYRDMLITDPGRVKLIHLTGSRELLRERLTRRENHFAPATLLESQMATLETPPYALTLDVSASPEELVSRIRQNFAL